MPSFDPVTAVARALEVLRIINQRGSAAVVEIRREIDMPKPTVVRMVETLIHEGYVVRDADRPVYSPTGKCLLLSNGFDRESRLKQVSAPILAEFRRKVGWPYSLAFFDATAMVEVASSREIGGTSAADRLAGRRIPMQASSLGRAYLAFCSPEERAQILQRMSALNAAQPGGEIISSDLERELAATMARGYSRADPEFLRTLYDAQVEAFGAPIFVSGKVTASVNVTFLPTAVSLEEAERTLVPELLAAARAIGTAIENDLGEAGVRSGLPDISPYSLPPRKGGVVV